MAIDNPDRAPARRLAVVGSLVGGLAVSSCCILPLALFGLGMGGAWIGNLTKLAPYQPFAFAFSAACLGYGYWSVWRARGTACESGAGCARPATKRLTMALLAIATILVAAAFAFDYAAPALLGV